MTGPVHGTLNTCPSTLAHGASCTKACDSGYTLAGTQPTCDDGNLTDTVECIEDIDCVGEWSRCDSACSKQYTVRVTQSGSGRSCPASHEAVAACNPGEGGCPADCVGLSAPAHGSMSTCGAVLAHGASCSKECDSGYTLAGTQPTCVDGNLTDTVECIEDIDCVGEWSVCTESCRKEYQVSAVQSGSGARCPVAHATVATCSSGEGNCPRTQAIRVAAPMTFAGTPDAMDIREAVAELVGLAAADVEIEITGVTQSVEQQVTFPGSVASFVTAEARQQLKSGLVSYLNDQLDGGSVSIDDVEIVSVRAAERRRLQSGGNRGVEIDYTVTSDQEIGGAFSNNPNFVEDLVAFTNSAGSVVPPIEPSEVFAEEPQISSEYTLNVIVAEDQAQIVTQGLAATVGGQTDPTPSTAEGDDNQRTRDVGTSDSINRGEPSLAASSLQPAQADAPSDANQLMRRVILVAGIAVGSACLCFTVGFWWTRTEERKSEVHVAAQRKARIMTHQMGTHYDGSVMSMEEGRHRYSKTRGRTESKGSLPRSSNLKVAGSLARVHAGLDAMATSAVAAPAAVDHLMLKRPAGQHRRQDMRWPGVADGANWPTTRSRSARDPTARSDPRDHRGTARGHRTRHPEDRARPSAAGRDGRREPRNTRERSRRQHAAPSVTATRGGNRPRKRVAY